MSLESLQEPISPEASLRYTVEEAVRYFGEPTGVYASPPKIILGSDGGLFHEAEISKDSISQAELGHMGAQVLAQEVAEIDIDQGLPYYIALRAEHKLGDIFVHVTLPDFNHPILVPSDSQKGRPTISTTVDSKVRATFDRDFMLNELLGELDAKLEITPDDRTKVKIQREIYLLKIMTEIVRPVKCKDSSSQVMSEAQERMLEDYLSTLFWPGPDNIPASRNRHSNVFRTLYQSAVAKVVELRFGKQ